MRSVIQEIDIDDATRSLSTLDRVDYTDLFTAAARVASGRSPEDLARALVDHAVGLSGQFVWRVILGLRLASYRSLEHVAGWKIAGRGDDWITLEAASRVLSANIILRTQTGRLSVATIIRYDRPFAALIWLPVSVFHRRAMPRLLRRALSGQRWSAL